MYISCGCVQETGNRKRNVMGSGSAKFDGNQHGREEGLTKTTASAVQMMTYPSNSRLNPSFSFFSFSSFPVFPSRLFDDTRPVSYTSFTPLHAPRRPVPAYSPEYRPQRAAPNSLAVPMHSSECCRYMLLPRYSLPVLSPAVRVPFV